MYSRVSIVGHGSHGCPQPIPACSMVSTVQQHVDLVTSVLDGFRHCPSLMLVKQSPLLESTTMISIHRLEAFWDSWWYQCQLQSLLHINMEVILI